MKLEKKFLENLVAKYSILEENQWYEQVGNFKQWQDVEDLFVFQYKNGKRYYTDGDIHEHKIQSNGHTGISCRPVKWE